MTDGRRATEYLLCYIITILCDWQTSCIKSLRHWELGSQPAREHPSIVYSVIPTLWIHCSTYGSYCVYPVLPSCSLSWPRDFLSIGRFCTIPPTAQSSYQTASTNGTKAMCNARFPPFRCRSSVVVSSFPLAVAVSVHRCRCRCVTYQRNLIGWPATKQRNNRTRPIFQLKNGYGSFLPFTAVTERNFLT